MSDTAHSTDRPGVTSLQEYAYNRRHFLAKSAKQTGLLTGAPPNELQQDSGWQRPAE